MSSATVKPIDQRGPRASRETLWRAIKKKKVFTLSEITRCCDLKKGTISQYLRTWALVGALETKPIASKGTNSQGEGYRRPLRYTLIKDLPEFPRVRKNGTEIDQGKATQQMWTTMRKLRFFSVSDVHALSSTPRHPVTRRHVAEYMKYLILARYIEYRSGVYYLVKDTGPKAPMIQRIKQVWDPNLKKVMWRQGDEICERCVAALRAVRTPANKGGRDE